MPRAGLRARAVSSLFRFSAFPSLPPRPPAPGAPARQLGRPPARESAALAGGASSRAAEPTAAPSQGPCSGPRRHARTPHAHRLPAALSASAAVSRDGPGSPLHRLSDHPRELGCRAVLHFLKNRPGGRDLLWQWSVPGLFPIQCGPHVNSGRRLSETFGEKSRGVTCRVVGLPAALASAAN